MNSAALRTYFEASDKDRSGMIDDRELQGCLSNGTWKPFNLETVRLMINLFDRNGDGRIDYREFEGLWHYIQDWQNVYTTYLKSNSSPGNTLDSETVFQALSNSGIEVTRDLVRLMVKRCNTNGDERRVDFDDFIHICILVQKIDREFNKLSSQASKGGTSGESLTVKLDRVGFTAVVFKLIAPSFGNSQSK